ncbi:MAG: bifunctional UDP-sugar hydrolase/5'-nucleotidase [Tissierellia bacterium]|nr:bifunctional UDP-sugar hydrolase/5'-nucleotidase [Tissierellia bacterium]
MEDKVKISILGTSDVHGYYMPWDYSKDELAKKGGLSRVSTVVKRIRQENPTILIDCGDIIQGNSAEVFIDRENFPGMQVANAMKYEIINMGNHEFNFGMDKLQNVMEQFKGITMMGNLYRKNGNRLMNGYYIKHIEGLKIGFIGLNTPLVRHFEEKRGNLKDHTITDADEELKKLLDEIGEVDALIGVFHMGYKNENNIPNTGVIDVLESVPNSDKINVIFGGHMHQVIEGMKIKNSIFVQPGVFGEVVNKVDLYFDKSKKDKLEKIETSVIKIDETIESDKEIEKILEPYHEELRGYANEVVGYIEKSDLYERDLITGIPQSRVAQTRVVEFFLEVMKHYSQADVVATHMDNAYPMMPKGEVKRKHIYNSYRYAGGDISNYKITGKELKIYMEWSAGYFNQSEQGDINISFDKKRAEFKYSTFDIFGNIKYVIDITKPMGTRIKDLKYMDGREIKDDDEIILGVNKYRMDFLLSELGPLHGHDIHQFWTSMTEPSFEVRGTIRNLAMKFFEECKDMTYCPVDSVRWYVKTAPTNQMLRYKAIELINRGILDLHKKPNGEIDLSRSLNLFDEVTEEQYKKFVNAYPFLYPRLEEDMMIMDLIEKVM